jgi:hypothetical protein
MIQERRPGNLRLRQVNSRWRQPLGESMTCLKINLPASETLTSLLSLSQPLKAQDLLEQEHSLVGKLVLLGRNLVSDYVGLYTEHAMSSPDAAEIEYASWMPDPGALEVASWSSNMRGAVR